MKLVEHKADNDSIALTIEGDTLAEMNRTAAVLDFAVQEARKLGFANPRDWKAEGPYPVDAEGREIQDILKPAPAGGVKFRIVQWLRAPQ